jgi:hypothetical protein
MKPKLQNISKYLELDELLKEELPDKREKQE